MPSVNLLMFIAVVVLVLLFKTSASLASAYGMAVIGSMLVDTMLAYILIRRGWRWPLVACVALIAPFALVECSFLLANLGKFFNGGYLPVLMAVALVSTMLIWTRGTGLVAQRTRQMLVPLDGFVASIEKRLPDIVHGTAMFLTAHPNWAPTTLLHNLKHNRILHEQNVVLKVSTVDIPKVPLDERVTVERLGRHFLRVELRFGFMETPNISQALKLCRKQGLRFDIMSTSFFLGRRTFFASGRHGLPKWQARIFIALSRVAAEPTKFYHLPPNGVIELGDQLNI